MNESPKEEKILRLAKPMRKGLLRLIFSRFLLILLLLVLEVVLVVGMFRRLNQYFPYLAALQTVFTLGMVMYLFNSRMDSSAKLTWMLIIAVLPLPGAAQRRFEPV